MAKIARSGVYDADGQAVQGYEFFFLTLTAPSFGPTHHVPKWAADRGRCRCGVTHDADDDLRGLPLDVSTYDFRGQIRWHQGLSRLWKAASMGLRRLAPTAAFFAVRETQARLALHLHVIIRVPTVDADGLTPEMIYQATVSTTATHPLSGETLVWGKRGGECHRVAASRSRDFSSAGPASSENIGRVIGYVTKALNYTLKSVSEPFTDAPASLARVEFVQRLRMAARLEPCERCPSREDGGVEACTSPGHRNLGASSHVVTVSRPRKDRASGLVVPGWSFSGLTRVALREQRRVWREANGVECNDEGLDDSSLRIADYLRRTRSARFGFAHAESQEGNPRGPSGAV